MINYELQTLRDVWEANLSKFPRKAGVIHRGQPYTYREADAMAESLASHLALHYGLSPGDPVAVAMPNCLEWFIAYWSTVKLGGIVLPINTRLQGAEMEHVLRQAEPKVLIVHADSWSAVAPSLERVNLPTRLITSEFSVPGSTDLRALAERPAGKAPLNTIAPEDIAIVMHTSGTTGVPKAAMMRHCDLMFNLKLAIFAHSFRHEDVHLLVVPMFRPTATYSMLPSSAYLGSTLVMAPHSDLPELVDLIEAHRATTFIGVPTMFHFLAAMKGLEGRDLSSLRLLAYSGAPMPPVTIHRLREKFPRVALHNFFGLTETISMTHVLPDADACDRAESIGKLLPEVYQRIVSEEGNEVSPGEIGELCFRKENVICDYWKQPGLLAQSMTDDGWFRTGDLALVDEDGYVYLKGRKKDMIIVGGENVYAMEVENCLLTHEDILDAAVIGVQATGARSYLGELVKAFVVLRPGTQLRELDIKRYCSERLPSYKVPQLLEFRHALPRNAAGKLMKRELQ